MTELALKVLNKESDVEIPKPLEIKSIETKTDAPVPSPEIPFVAEIKDYNKPSLIKALMAVQKVMPKLVFDSQVKAGAKNYKFASLGSILDVVKPLLAKHGLLLMQELDADGLRTTLMHESGEFISSNTPLKPLSTPGAQGRGSGITYARRYAITAMFGLFAEDDDDAGDVKPVPYGKK